MWWRRRHRSTCHNSQETSPQLCPDIGPASAGRCVTSTYIHCQREWLSRDPVWSDVRLILAQGWPTAVTVGPAVLQLGSYALGVHVDKPGPRACQPRILDHGDRIPSEGSTMHGPQDCVLHRRDHQHHTRQERDGLNQSYRIYGQRSAAVRITFIAVIYNV